MKNGEQEIYENQEKCWLQPRCEMSFIIEFYGLRRCLTIEN